MPVKALANFLRMESSGGLLLIAAAALALAVSNSPLAGIYERFLETRLAFLIGEFGLDKPLLLWINDGLMAIFFLLIGLELKREILEGQLSSRDQVVLPVIGAVGGFLVPAAIYIAVNRGDASALNGWAIPSATDIAFALGILALLGQRVPLFLKVFLTSLAIIDDLAAILTIAVFYTSDLSLVSLGLGGLGALVLLAMNRLGVYRIAAYVLVGVAIWFCVLKSGVHATLAGVLVAFTIPLRARAERPSPLRLLEHSLHPWVAYLILPLFAFANAGVPLGTAQGSSLINGVSLGIVAGLFLGKQVGVFGCVWLAARLGLARLPAGASWMMFYGVSVLTGVGFTMSLFIGTLAFEHGNFEYADATRVGVLAGSLLSAVLGYLLLRYALDARWGPQSAETSPLAAQHT